jgi:hypothetical protein
MVINDLNDLVNLGVVMLITWVCILAVYFDRRKQ